MKRFLRHAFCVAVMLLLIVCPVKALAASGVQGGVEWPSEAPTRGNSGGSTFKIQQVEKYCYAFLTVVDADTLPGSPYYSGEAVPAPIPNLNITLTCNGLGSTEIASFHGEDISEVSLTDHSTDAEGKIGFRLPIANKSDEVTVKFTQPGFHEFTQTIRLGGKKTSAQLEFVPIHLDVYFYSDWHGTFESDPMVDVRWGKTLQGKMPEMTVNPDWALVGWKDRDTFKVYTVSELENMEITEDLHLDAQYRRQYLVQYEAGDYGYLDGVTHEMVIEGQKPKHVPTPVPMSDREYRFVEWRVVSTFTTKGVDPSSMTITGNIAFEAIFDVRKRQPVIIKTPPAEQNPSAPAPESSASVPVAGGIGGGPGSGPGGGNPAVSSSAEMQPSGQEETSAVPGQGEAPGRDGTQPERPGESSPAQPAGRTNPDIQPSRWFWPTLLCCLLTLAAGTLRLRAVNRTIKHLAHSKDGEDTAPDSLKPIVTEVIAGLICVILWGSLYARHGGSLSLAALVLWAVILLVMAVLLIRAEYSLRHRPDKSGA